MMKIRDIMLNVWYTCWYIDRSELCKVTRATIDVTSNDTKVFAYKVVCYYTGKDIYVGPLKECRQWIMDHLEGVKTYG